MMQLKLRRSQRDGGIIGRTAIFCLDARVEFTREEQSSITRYKLGGQVIYNSEASRKHLDRSMAQNDGSLAGGLRSLASAALAGMSLNISINSLQKGQHIECKSLEELLGAEEAVSEACRNLRGFLDAAATFDGREIILSFESGKEPETIAQAAPPQQLIAPAAAPPEHVSAPVHYEQPREAPAERSAAAPRYAQPIKQYRATDAMPALAIGLVMLFVIIAMILSAP